jgi:biopolymer transport protein ExbD
MPKMKIHRKSTSVDMTAMCDVAFLLLSFFIFTAKFKKPEEVPISIPAAVTTNKLDTSKKGMFNVFCEVGKKGEVLIGLENETYMEALGSELAGLKQIGLTKRQLEAFKKKSAVGASFEDLAAYLDDMAAGRKVDIKGIPVKDSTNNQLRDWISAITNVNGKYLNVSPEKFNVFIKADKDTPFDIIDKIMTTWSNAGKDQFKLVTMLKDIPINTEMYEERNKAEAKEE